MVPKKAGHPSAFPLIRKDGNPFTMARLILKSDGFNERVFDLKLGVNRIGRSPDTDLQIDHDTVSGVHCEVSVADGEMLVRDCASTNGTFFQGEPIKEVRLNAGQRFCVGAIEVLVESTDVAISIPVIEVSLPAPPVVRTDGSVLCQRHPEAQVTHRCSHCSEMLCDDCVKRLRRRGGKVLKLCSLCSHPVERIGEKKKKKKTLLGFLQKTVKMPFFQNRAKG
jgi:hypothetical protein